MDPLSQALVGAVVAGTASKKEHMRRAIAVGALSAMAADLDVMIHSADDPLLSLTFHRHFTHSFIFIPIGALICSSVLSLFFRVNWKRLYFPAFLGYSTAGLLDALTSYGTHLFWPFNDERTAWNCISIVDPIYTVVLLFLTAFSFIKLKMRLLYVALLFIVFWHAYGLIQRERAEHVLFTHAQSQGYEIERLWAQPSLFNLIIWRGLIETPKKIYVCAVRVGLSQDLFQAGSYQRYFKDKDKAIKESSVLANDIERFTHFSSGFVAKVKKGKESVLTDARYSPMPWGLEPLWALEMNYDDQNRHARMKYFRHTRALKMRLFWNSIKGRGVFTNN